MVAVDKMGSFRFLKEGVCVVIMVVGALILAESTILVHFDRAPPARSRFSTAVFQYSIKRPDASDACKDNDCSLQCELDGQILRKCPTDTIQFKNLRVNSAHTFILKVTARSGETNSSTYVWFIDTIPPTATISSQQNYTNADKITIDIKFSEACTGQGGFQCMNSSNCDVILDGPGHVHASSLRIIKPYIRYSVDVILSLKSTYERVVVRMADKICTDIAGNNFKGTNSSAIIIHIDRRPVLVDFWISLRAYVLEINGVPRTVLAAKQMEDLEIFLDFSIPIMNSTAQLLNAFHLNFGNLIPTQNRGHMNRRFVFKLKNVPKTEIITIELQTGLLIGITGTPVSPVPSIAFLYDSTRPGVGLSTSSPSITKAPNINVIVEFTKPVFGFEASMVDVNGGRLTSFKEISRALYSLNVQALTQNVVSIYIPAGKVNDISGNLNLASNRIEVKHYSTPAISTALHSFVTAGVLATSLAAAFLSLSSANLGATSTHTSGFNFLASDPSMNLHGMVGHLQVFVLSDWLSANQPVVYSETTKGLRWLIPRQKLPWRKDSSSLWPNHVYLAKQKLSKQFEHLCIGSAYKRSYHQIGLNLTNSSYSRHGPLFPTAIDPKFDWPYGRRLNLSMKNTPYGLPLNSKEYFTYFLRGEPLSASNVVKKMENYKGWQDLEMNLFWLAVGCSSLLIIHVLALIFLRWRMGTSVHGILSVPRFELFLLILMLPCISQSAAFVLRGATTGGIVTGALLLSIPVALILSVCLFLVIAIFLGSFAQYKEIRHVAMKEPWHTNLWFSFTGRPVKGKWFYREGLPSSFFALFGILFENRKGPTLFVFVDENDPNTMPNWTESDRSGIGRMRAVSSDDSNEDIRPLSGRILGCARSSYIVLDLLRRSSLGIVSGAYSSNQSSQRLFALTITVIQLTCLFTLKPYIRRGVHVAESISLLCEVGILSICIRLNDSNPTEADTLGFVMLALLFLTFVAQITNEWYAMIKCILRLSQPQKNSFKVGLKFVARGLLLPFLPREHWSKVMPGSFQPMTSLTPVIPLSPEEEYGRRDTRGPSAMTATVVPVLSPGSPGPNIIEMTGSAPADAAIDRKREVEGKRGKGVKLETKSEMKKLRELAKASFSGDSTGEEASTSYAFRMQPISPETSSANPQASTSKFKH